MMNGHYGKEVILDLYECDSRLFTRTHIRSYFKALCNKIDMQRDKLCWWDDLHTLEKDKQTESHLVGTSAVQFIKTSNITIHTLDMLGTVYINIFSCKDFDAKIVRDFTKDWFRGKVYNYKVIMRG